MFSELVDRAVHVAGRPDMLEDIAYFANETMRDISKREDFDDDSLEVEIAVPLNTRTVQWDPPKQRPFRREKFIIDGCNCEPVRVHPSRKMLTHPGGFYYVSGKTFIFSRVCHPIRMFYYAYQPWLSYYPQGARPATFDVRSNDWSTTDPVLLAQVTNWLLERHNELVLNGALARFFKAKQDQRQQVHYSAYEQGLTHLIRSESPLEVIARR